jgi:hypothetical protein
MIGPWHRWYLDWNWFGRACPYLLPMRLHEYVARSFAVLSASGDISKYRFFIILIEVSVSEFYGGREVCCDEDLLHRFFRCVGCLVTCTDGLSKMGWQRRWTTFLVVLFEYRVTISRMKARPSLVLPGNDLAEGIVLWNCTFFMIKT